MALADDLRDECDALRRFVASIPPGEMAKPTAFFGWSALDEILHLIWVDRLAIAAAEDPDRFAALRDAQIEAAKAGVEMSEQARREYGGPGTADIIKLWHERYEYLCDTLGAMPPEHRIGWFGPEMSIASMLAARQMEVWAHGQDIYDLFQVARPTSARLRHICDLGVRTFGWSFANRGIPRPGPAPRVALSGPGGETWVWNETAEESVEGPAEDFALVVTQRRNIADVALIASGDGAAAWLQIAQCFAGPPASPPAPGERHWNADGATRAE